MKEHRRNRTRRQRRSSKYRTKLPQTISEQLKRIRRDAHTGTAHAALEDAIAQIECELLKRNFAVEEIRNIIARVNTLCGYEYRAWLAQEIRREARGGNAYARFIKPATQCLHEADWILGVDMYHFEIEPEQIQYAVHDAVSAVMRPPRKHSDVT